MFRVAIGICIALLVWSCCGNIACDLPPNQFYFAFVSQSGEDLLAGDAKKYEISDLRFYSITAGSRQDVEIQFLTSEPLTTGVVYPYNLASKYFFEAKGVTRDTLNVVYRMLESRCCGNSTVIDKLFLNGVETNLGQDPQSAIRLIERN